MGLAFGPMAGKNDILFNNLRSMSLSRDAGAPVNITEKDLKDFENRNDMRGLRSELDNVQHTGSKPDVRSIKSKIKDHVQTLSELRLGEIRAEYFRRVDRLRAEGLPTSASPQQADANWALQNVQASGGSFPVAQFISSCTPELVEGCSVEQRAKKFMELLVDFLAHRPKSDLLLGPANPDVEAGDDTTELLDEYAGLKRMHAKNSRCLLCNQSFCSRSDLTRHCQKVHIKSGTFNWSFMCPECLRLGKGDILIEAEPSAWSNHAETTHGKNCAPNFPSVSPPTKASSLCMLCKLTFQEGKGLWTHTRRIHDQKEQRFDQAFQCPECHKQGRNGDLDIGSFQDWKCHVQSVHTGLEEQQPPSSRWNSNEPCPDNGPPQGSNTDENKKDEESVMPDFAAGNDLASCAIRGNWFKFPMATSNTTYTAPETTTDLLFEAQPPASSIDSATNQTIDPRPVSAYPKPGCAILRTSMLDFPRVIDHGKYLSTREGHSRHTTNAETEYTTLEISGSDRGSSASSQSDSLFDASIASLSGVGPIDPLILSMASPHPSGSSPEPGQEGVRGLKDLSPSISTSSKAIGVTNGGSSPRGRNDDPLPNPFDQGAALPDHTQFQAGIIQGSTQDENVQPRSTPALIPKEKTRNLAQRYWGKGYDIAPEGSEPDRGCNNAKRRREISSEIITSNVIQGKRRRFTKNT